MSKILALTAALLGTAGSLFMAGWGLHAEIWWIVFSSGLVGMAGMMSIGLMAWLSLLDL